MSLRLRLFLGAHVATWALLNATLSKHLWWLQFRAHGIYEKILFQWLLCRWSGLWAWGLTNAVFNSGLVLTFWGLLKLLDATPVVVRRDLGLYVAARHVAFNSSLKCVRSAERWNVGNIRNRVYSLRHKAALLVWRALVAPAIAR